MSAPKFNYLGFRPDIASGLDLFDLQADQAGFVGLKIAPVFEAPRQSGEFRKRLLEDILIARRDDRDNDGTYARGEIRFTKDNYQTSEHGFEVLVDNRESTVHRHYADLEMEAAAHARDVVLRNHNDRVITAALAVSNTTAAGTAWSTTATADPVANVRTAKLAVRNRIGIMPNAVVMDAETFENCRDCTTLRSRLTNIGLVGQDISVVPTVEMVRQALNVQYLFISNAMKNTASQPLTASLTQMWDKTKCLVFLYDDSPYLRPCFMRTFHWGEDGSTIGTTFESYFSPERRGNVMRNRFDTQEKTLYSSAAQLITGC